MHDELVVTLDAEDIEDVYKPAPRRTRLRNLVLVLALMLVLLIITLLVRFPETRPMVREDPFMVGLIGAITLVVLLLAVLVATAPAIRRYVSRSTLDHHPGMRDAIQYAFDDERFAMRATYSQASYPWDLLWDWRETERVIIVLPTPRNFYVIPKRGVDPELLERLRERLAACRKRQPKRHDPPSAWAGASATD